MDGKMADAAPDIFGGCKLVILDCLIGIDAVT